MIRVREAAEADVEGIREVFRSCYGESYAYPQYYDPHVLKKMVFDSDTLLLVAEDTDKQAILGTASVILDLGAHGDLMGEFGRLAVHPDGRNRGIGNLLMEGRLNRIEDRLHIAIIENRVVHPYSQKISARYGFTAAGFLPMKLRFDERESVALYVRHFDAGLTLRRNHPRVIAEAYPIAEHVLSRCGCPNDAVADDDTAPHPRESGFTLREMTTEGYASLLRLERGRIRHREIFGPVRLHTGLFRIRVSHANYLLACDGDQVCGGIGFTVDEIERAVQIFELVSVDSRPIHFLLSALEEKCRKDGDIDYIEVDVNAHAPAMQRSLLELGFLPIGYVPAMVFHRVERIDSVKMARLLATLDVTKAALHETTEPIAQLVLRAFEGRELLPRLTEFAKTAPLFSGMSIDQIRALSAIASLHECPLGKPLFRRLEPADTLYLLVRGEIEIAGGDEGTRLATIGPGDTLGEVALLGRIPTHTAEAIPVGPAELIGIPFQALQSLLRRRPDIGTRLYQNLASQLGQKLLKADDTLLQRTKGRA